MVRGRTRSSRKGERGDHQADAGRDTVCDRKPICPGDLIGGYPVVGGDSCQRFADAHDVDREGDGRTLLDARPRERPLPRRQRGDRDPIAVAASVRATQAVGRLAARIGGRRSRLDEAAVAWMGIREMGARVGGQSQVWASGRVRSPFGVSNRGDDSPVQRARGATWCPEAPVSDDSSLERGGLVLGTGSRLP